MSTEISALNNRPVIIGGGAAGLMTALQMAPEPVLLLSKAPLGAEASSLWAQGGLAAAMGGDDGPALHLADTLAAGAGLCDESVASRIVHAAPAAVEHLARLGVAFDRRPDGGWRLGLEAAHGRNRIVHATGDGTGREIMRALIAAVRRCPSVTLLEGVEARSLIVEDNSIKGVLAVNARGPLVIDTGRVVIATGGIGGLFLDSTNPAGCFGQGLGAGRACGRAALRSRVHPVSPDRLRRAAAPDAAGHRGRARRRRRPDRRHRATLHGRPARRRACGARHRCARGLASSRRRTSRLPRCTKTSRTGLCQALSRHFRVLQNGRDRSRDRSDSSPAGGALPHGRDSSGHRGPQHRERPLGLRRSQPHGVAWRQPARQQFADGSDRLCGMGCGERPGREPRSAESALCQYAAARIRPFRRAADTFARSRRAPRPARNRTRGSRPLSDRQRPWRGGRSRAGGIDDRGCRLAARGKPRRTLSQRLSRRPALGCAVVHLPCGCARRARDIVETGSLSVGSAQP